MISSEGTVYSILFSCVLHRAVSPERARHSLRNCSDWAGAARSPITGLHVGREFSRDGEPGSATFGAANRRRSQRGGNDAIGPLCASKRQPGISASIEDGKCDQISPERVCLRSSHISGSDGRSFGCRGTTRLASRPFASVASSRLIPTDQTERGQNRPFTPTLIVVPW